MITINSKGRLCIPDEDVFIGFIGDNLNLKREFFLEGITDPTTIYRMYLLFDDGTSNFFLLDKELMDNGTKLIWNIESDHIFKSGIVILQIKGTNNQGKIFHTCQTSLVVQKSIEFSESYNTVVNSEFLQQEEKLNGIVERANTINAEAETIYKKIKEADIDSEPTENSASPVASGGVYSALGVKLNDATGSVKENNIADNAVTSGKIMNDSISFEKLQADTMIDTSSNYGMAYAFGSDTHIPTTGFVKAINEETKENLENKISQVDSLFTKKECYLNQDLMTNVGNWYFNTVTGTIMRDTSTTSARSNSIELPAGTYTINDFRAVHSYIDDGRETLHLSGNDGLQTMTITRDKPFTLYITTGTSPIYNNFMVVRGDTVPTEYQQVGMYGIDTSMELESVKKLKEKIEKMISDASVITVKKDGTGTFTTLKEAVEYSQNHSDLTIKVYEGTYDLIEEFGEEYFANLTGPGQNQGLHIGNGVHLIFSSGSKVVCHYQGDNDVVKTCFSPLNFTPGTSGFTLENLTLEASNVRYAIHDEGGSRNTPNAYRNVYKNCNITIDNSNNTAWKQHNCIGGGLGLHGEIIIENCSFTDKFNINSRVGTVSYHNAVTEGAKSRIIVTGCYFSDNTSFRLSYYGNSTEITEALVSNCSMTHQPYVTAESSGYTTENVKLIQWNNEIRNS